MSTYNLTTSYVRSGPHVQFSDVHYKKRSFTKWVNTPHIYPIYDIVNQAPYFERYMNIHIWGVIERFMTVLCRLNNCQSHPIFVIKQVYTDLDDPFLSSALLSITPCIHPLIATFYCPSQTFPLFLFAKIYHFSSF